ncbi:hypothetical protein [Bifidobacterium pseudolongum]|uniref:hypothetical protein n=1 Tax=Bifidobacterium pseudolongum TaxID=1694 RepID=UPI0013EB9454|nr:hypothetical protein [Bifidobacterium pseudolongum]
MDVDKRFGNRFTGVFGGVSADAADHVALALSAIAVGVYEFHGAFAPHARG